MNPYFSVIIPCYNAAELVGICLNTLAEQTIGIDHLEIIAVDDASTDTTQEVLKEFEKKYPDNFILVALDQNSRQGAARNIGLRYASGEYISFVDADDHVRRDMYEVLYEVIRREEPDVVQFKHDMFVDPGEISEEAFDIEHILTDPGLLKVYDFASDRRSFLLNSGVYNESCWQKVYKRDLIQATGVSFAEGVAYEEPRFTYPLKFFLNKLVTLDLKLYHYRANANGTTFKYMSDPNTIFDHLTTQLETRSFVDGFPETEQYREEKDLYFTHCFYCEPFYFFKKRGWSMPVSLWRFIGSKLVAVIPDPRSNRYLNDPTLAEEKALLDLMRYDKESDDVIREKLDAAMERLLV